MTTMRQGRRVAGAVVAAGLGLGVLAGCGEETSGPEQGATVGEIQQDQEPAEAAESEDVMSFVGQTVTVSADVNEIITPTAFTLGDDLFGEPLLVVSGEPAPQLNPDSPVQVTGTVMQAFDLVAVESELGVDFDDALFTDFDGEPYIVASNIDTTVDFTTPMVEPASPTPTG